MKWRTPNSLMISIGMHATLVLLVIFASRDSKHLNKFNIPLNLISKDRTVVTASVQPEPGNGTPAPENTASATDRHKQRPTAERKDPAVPSQNLLSEIVESDKCDSPDTGDAQDPLTHPVELEKSAASPSQESGPGNGTGKGDSGIAHAQRPEDTRATEYAMLVRHRLEQRGAYPKTARRLGLEGRVEMILKIDSSGSVANTTIHSSSGFRELDEAAVASSLSIGLLPPPPDNRAIEIVVPVRFSMRRM